MKINIQNKLSFWAIIIYSTIAFTCRDSYRPYNNPQKIVAYDMQGYYSYLQAFFIYDDLNFKFIDNNPSQCMKVPVLDANGNKVIVNKYSIGPAILNAPFFFLGHLESYWQQVPRDGFSYTYLFWVMTGNIIYIIISLFLLRSVLLRYYSDAVVGTTLLSLGLGTNLLHYTIFEFLMSHCSSFFLFTLAMYLVIKWIENQKTTTFLFLSFVCGLIAVTRLPNMIFFVVLAMWKVYDKESLWERLRLFQKEKKAIAFGLFFFFIPFIPQIYYWYTITGKFYVNAYYENYEYFYWTHPMIAEVLIGYRKGWLIYTPIMMLGVLGFITLYKEQKEIFKILFIFSILNIYVVSCWSTWWYGGSFGMRALIEGSVVFAFPLASFLTYLSKNIVVSHISAIIVGFFMLLNMFQSYQYVCGVIHYADMTRPAYWAVFGVMPPAHKYHIEQRNKYLKMGTGAEARRETYTQTIW